MLLVGCLPPLEDEKWWSSMSFPDFPACAGAQEDAWRKERFVNCMSTIVEKAKKVRGRGEGRSALAG